MKSVLIADPDYSARKALALILKHRLGVEKVLEAADVETLIRAMADCQPELLLDWTLYGAPAPETCLLLRKAFPSLKIVLLSANLSDTVAAQKTEAAFVHKGAAPEQLLATLATLFKE